MFFFRRGNPRKYFSLRAYFPFLFFRQYVIVIIRPPIFLIRVSNHFFLSCGLFFTTYANKLLNNRKKYIAPQYLFFSLSLCLSLSLLLPIARYNQYLKIELIQSYCFAAIEIDRHDWFDY